MNHTKKCHIAFLVLYLESKTETYKTHIKNQQELNYKPVDWFSTICSERFIMVEWMERSGVVGFICFVFLFEWCLILSFPQ